MQTAIKPVKPTVEDVSLNFFPRKSIFGILSELNTALREQYHLSSAIVGSRLSVTGSWSSTAFPQFTRILCSVSGNKTGRHYVHVDLVTQDGNYESIYVARVMGTDKAWEVARACSVILGA